MPVVEHEVHPFGELALHTSLEEMEQLLKLGELRWERPEGRPWAPFLAKVWPRVGARYRGRLYK